MNNGKILGALLATAQLLGPQARAEERRTAPTLRQVSTDTARAIIEEDVKEFEAAERTLKTNRRAGRENGETWFSDQDARRVEPMVTAESPEIPNGRLVIDPKKAETAETVVVAKSYFKMIVDLCEANPLSCEPNRGSTRSPKAPEGSAQPK